MTSSENSMATGPVEAAGIEIDAAEHAAVFERLSCLFRRAGKDAVTQALFRAMLEYRLEKDRCASST